ncbi:MAG: DEAD/DEAH box helicase [Candidatus Micrarchaeaceae archaeon]
MQDQISVYDLFLERFGSLTDIQQAALPIVYGRSNCLIIAATGSGKTEAAVIPVMQRLFEEKNKKERFEGIKAIYITPLRALNRDLLKRLDWLAKNTGIEIAIRHGDTPQSERQKQAAKPPIILITTPESLQNLFLSQRLRKALENVEAIIIDEVHELFYNKRGAQLAIALERLEAYAKDFQRIGISATVGNVDEVKEWLFNGKECKIAEAPEAKRLEISIEMPKKPEHELKTFEKQFGIDSKSLARIECIADSIRKSKSVLIFANTRQIVESLGNKLIYFDKQEPFGGIGVHHSSLDKAERISVENAFKEGALKSIIATSSLELGIDIGSVDLVIQYGSPKQVTRLVQRVGRGGHREHAIANGKIVVANIIDALESLAILIQAKENRLEKQHMQKNAKDVLINQLCGISLEYGKLDADKAYGIIKRAAPYSSLSREEFDKTVAFAVEQKLLKRVGNELGQGARTRNYFYANISVIPEISKYTVKDIVTNKTIASLDESFVSKYLDEGTVFITKGVTWRVVSIDEQTVTAELSKDIEAAVPDWEGEDIPVTKETAKMVFELISQGAERYKKLINNDLLNAIEEFSIKQRKFFEPINSKLIIERGEDFSIIYAPLGRLANELIARLIAYAVSVSSGRQVNATATPYAIIVRVQSAAQETSIERLLSSGALLQLMKGDAYLVNSDLFRYRLVQTAKLAGVIEKSATVTRSSALKLLNFYKGTPVYEEAKRDILENYFDIETATSFLKEVKLGNISVETNDGISALGNELLKANYAYGELLVETHSEEEINNIKKELIGKNIELFCTYCGFVFEHEITEKDERILCQRCKSPMLCVYTDARLDAWQKKKKGKKVNEKEQKDYEEMIRETGLVEAYGNRALMALSTYGIGLETAARVLKMLRKSYKEFYIDLLNAQRNFIKTRKYWKA